MNDPRRPEWSDPTQPDSEYPPTTDPAYSGQYPGQSWGPTYYGPGYGAQPNQPTQQLPAYWQQGSPYTQGYPPPPPPPPPPKSPRWLWIAAAGAVLLVAGLVLALVIVSSSSRESTVVAPASPSSTTTTAPRATTVPRVPSPTTPRRVPQPFPTTVPQPTDQSPTPGPVGTDTVVYSVTGEGRAINITYVDTGGIMQTEFNVALPWSKEVALSAPAKNSASVAVVNVGRDVTCAVSVNGAQVRQRTGRGLTICTGLS
ncbi:MAG: MmpS family transport accessory protein [Mycobacterium sp.]